MLDQMRNLATGWVAKILIGMLVLSFAIWGIADIFRGFSNDVVATVGDIEIPAIRYRIEFNRRLNEYSKSFETPLTVQDARRYGLDRNVLVRLVGTAALNAAVMDLGLAISDETVAQDIRLDEAFHGPYGRFDKQQFELVIRNNGLTEADYIADRREFMARDQLLSSVTAGDMVPYSLPTLIYAYQHETRVANYLILTPAFITNDPEPTEEEIKQLHAGGGPEFTRPMTRDFSILQIRPSILTDTIEISEDEVLAEFESNKDRYDVPETRTLLQIQATDEEEATKFVSLLRQGDLDAVLNEAEITADDARLSDVVRKDLLSTQIADAAFALNTDEVSEPVEGPLGYVVLKLESISAAVPAKFADIKDELTEEIVTQKAQEEVFNLYNQIEDERAAGVALDDIADQLGFDLTIVKGVTRDGLDIDGNAVELPELAKLLANAFTYFVDEDTDAFETDDDGYYWLQVNAITKETIKPLEDIRDQVVAQWKQEKKRLALVDLADSMVTRGNIGTTLDAMAKEYKRSASVSPSLERDASDDTFSRQAVAKLFETPSGKFTSGPVGFGDSIILMQVKDVIVPDADENTEQIAETAKALDEKIKDDMIATLVQTLQKQHGVSINQPVIDQIIGTP